ncbi:MFS transporter [Brachybacterium sp. DNPG3]
MPSAVPSSAAAVMRSLVPSVYLPTLLEFTGQAALMPVIPLIALQLGFTVPQAAVLSLIFGVASFVGPIPAGRVISRIGARAALVATGIVLVVVNVAAYAVITPGLEHDPGALHRGALIGLLAVMAASSQIWTLGRQSFLGSALPPTLRARGMTTFGGMIRLGQVVGPLLGALVLGLGQDSLAFLFYATTSLGATVLVGCFLPHGEAAGSGRAAGPVVGLRARSEARRALDRAVLARMLSVGLGIAPVMIGRVNRTTIVPLLGAALGLDSSWVSIVFGVSAVVEILMVLPAGTLMDRFGRAAVAVPCALCLGTGYVLMAVLVTIVGDGSRSAAVLALVVPSALIALGNGLGSGIVMTLGIDVSPVHGRTGYLAWWNTMLGGGAMLAPLLVSGIALVAPVTVAGAVTGGLCLAGGFWLSRVLPRMTPSGGTRTAGRPASRR